MSTAAAIYLTHSADKSQRKLDKQLRQKILEALMSIGQSPEQKGEKLSQPLTGIYSHHLKYKGKEFRIAYQYDMDVNSVTILLIGPHENFYKRVKNLIDAIAV